MVGYELISLNNNIATYNYYPENNFGNKGVVSFDRIKNEPVVAIRATHDEYGFYSRHMFSMLRESNKTGNFRENGYIAWY